MSAMKFHNVHGNNITINEGGSRAMRCNSFCDGIVFGHRPLSINTRISILVGANEEWTGALRLGVMSHDPEEFLNKKLPKYACPELTSKNGFWARPLPEKWAADGNRLTFYLNSAGHFNLFVNSEHKGAILVGLPVTEQLWLLLDLYGITISVKFVSSTGCAPSEVVARGPEAVQAYQKALSEGSVPCYKTRIALIGPPGGGKTFLKKLLISNVGNCHLEKNGYCGINTSCVCQSTSECEGYPWRFVDPKTMRSSNGVTDENFNIEHDILKEDYSSKCEEKFLTDDDGTGNQMEEYLYAIAVNIVREILSEKKKKQEERRRTPLSRNTFRLHSSLSKIGPTTKIITKQDECMSLKDVGPLYVSSEFPDDVPQPVVHLVESLLKEAETKQDWFSKNHEKPKSENSVITFNLWEYSGLVDHFIMHQLFLSPRTIYLLVFDLSKKLDASLSPFDKAGAKFEVPHSSELSTLTFIHIWLEIIFIIVSHSLNGEEQIGKEDNLKESFDILLPPVIIVGTHKESVTLENQVEHQFNTIKESLKDKVYYRHVLPTFYAIGSELSNENCTVQELRKKIEELALQQAHVGMEIPFKWMLFEQAIDRLLQREVFFADINKLSEVARLQGIDSSEEFHSMIHFFHHQGKIWHLQSDILKENIHNNSLVILFPQWLINYIYQLFNQNCFIAIEDMKREAADGGFSSVDSNNCAMSAIVSLKNFHYLWPNAFHQTCVLLGILDSADIISETKHKELANECQNSKSYFLPWLPMCKFNGEKMETRMGGVVFVIEFSGSVPVGFFTRFLVCLYRCSDRQGHGPETWQTAEGIVIGIDYNHDIIVSKVPSVFSRIKVCLIQSKKRDDGDGIIFSFPLPHVCSKIYQLLETEIEHLQEKWYKRLSFRICVPCPCERQCELHSHIHCIENECLHLLPLHSCLTKKIVQCDYRQVKTDFVQKYFCCPRISEIPETAGYFSPGKFNEVLSLATPASCKSFWGEHDVSRDDPQWLKGAAKMLNSGNTGKDWFALSKRLGYNEREISKFEDDLHPANTLLNHWLESNGRTQYSIDLLVTCLQQMGRHDVAERMQIEIGPELPAPPVFISYQWDSQESVLYLRKRLEISGYACWMDVGQLGGGDTLYGRIYEGISKAKVILCCLTRRYALSPSCSREASLADVLRKPIVPVMMEPTPWPPPGPLAVILSSLVYIDLYGIGGHGGCGRQADWESRFQTILDRLAHFISPAFSGNYLTTTSTEKFIAPPDSVYTNEVSFENAEIPTDDVDSHLGAQTVDDDVSSVDTLTEQRAGSSVMWNRSHGVNRVVRCSICVIV